MFLLCKKFILLSCKKIEVRGGGAYDPPPPDKMIFLNNFLNLKPQNINTQLNVDCITCRYTGNFKLFADKMRKVH